MSEIDDSTRYFRISGTVQGVGFRAATRDQARSLNLAGWVRNRSDGDVEAVAAGRESAIAAFAQWLHTGPATAQVSNVQSEPRDRSQHTDLAAPFVIAH